MAHVVEVRDELGIEQPHSRRARWGALQSWVDTGSARTTLLAAASLLIAFVIWQLLSTFVFNPFLIPPPLVVFETAIPMVLSGEIISDVSISMVRVFVGFATGSAAAIVLGVLLGRIRLLHDLFDPVIELLRFLSPTAMIPIAVIWFGIGEMSKYFLIFWGTFFIVLINTVAGVWRAPLARQRAAECLGANQLQIFVLVMIPSAVPYIVTGMRVAMASVVHEYHPGRNPGGRFRYRLSVAEIVHAAANQPHLRGVADNLRARLHRRPHLSHCWSTAFWRATCRSCR